MLLHTFERAREAGMLDLVLHVQTLQPMFEKWPQSEQIRWWRVASEVSPSEQPRRFMEFVKKQYPQVAMLAGQSALCKRTDSGRQSGDEQKNKKKPAKATVNAAQAAAPAAPARAQQQQPAQRQYQQQQQNQRQGWNNSPPPCRMADKGCKENHKLDRCGVFGKLSAEQKLAALQERRLCIFCYKHQSIRDCYAKANAGYKGCGVGECGAHHADELHWVVQTARLFSVHAQPADWSQGLRSSPCCTTSRADATSRSTAAVTGPLSRRITPRRWGCSGSAATQRRWGWARLRLHQEACT